MVSNRKETGRKPSLQLIMALEGFFIQPSKKLPSPRARASTNSRMDFHASGQSPSGQVPSVLTHEVPVCMSHVCSIGFS